MRKVVAAALIAGAVAAPASVIAAKPAPPVKPVPMVMMNFVGVVQADATADGVVVAPAKGINIFARRSLAGAKELTLKFGPNTKIRRIIIKADGTKVVKVETFANLKAGDKVKIQVRAKKGTLAADLPAARFIRDFTPNPPAPPAPSTEPGTTVTPLG